jgi:hypothetical protein
MPLVQHIATCGINVIAIWHVTPDEGHSHICTSNIRISSLYNLLACTPDEDHSHICTFKIRTSSLYSFLAYNTF